MDPDPVYHVARDGGDPVRGVLGGAGLDRMEHGGVGDLLGEVDRDPHQANTEDGSTGCHIDSERSYHIITCHGNDL